MNFLSHIFNTFFNMISNAPLFFFNLPNMLGTYKTEIITTVVLAVFLTLAYKTFAIYIGKQEFSYERKHRALVNARNLFTFVFVIFTFFFWIGEIKASLLSLAAIGGATIITFKEIILSFVGTLISNHNFQLGDYIEMDGLPGKIINKTFLNTTVLLNDTHQTQELIIPNLIFLTVKVKKLSKIPKAQFVSFAISVDSMDKMFHCSEKARKISETILKEYNPDYEGYFKQIDEVTPYFEIPKSIVSIGFEVSDPRRLHFTVNFVCRPSQMGQIKDEILSKYLSTMSFIGKTDSDAGAEVSVTPNDFEDTVIDLAAIPDSDIDNKEVGKKIPYKMANKSFKSLKKFKPLGLFGKKARK